MKLLITSDVHGDLEGLKDVIKKHPDITHHINAGDMCLDPKLYETYHIITVKGNNDFGVDLPYHRLLDIEDHMIFLSHGHLEMVKFGYERLVVKAKMYQAKLVIFGHTHQRYLEKIDDMMIINPGALGDYNRSYAIYENGQITFYKR